MNAPLAQLVLSRVTDAARHSARLRHALRNRRICGLWELSSPRPARLRRQPRGWLVASRWTIGPRGVLP